MELNVLFSSVGRRVELVKAFREASNELKVKSKLIGVDMDELAPALNFVDKKYKVPKLSSEEFIPQIIEICKKENVAIIIPTLDTELLLYSKNKELIQNECGAKVMVSDENVISTIRNKVNSLFNFDSQQQSNQLKNKIDTLYGKQNTTTAPNLKENDFRVPKLIKEKEILDKEYEFPLFIKPLDGSSSINNFKINNEKELGFFKDYVSNPMIQEFSEGQEYCVDVFCDFKGNVITVVPKIRIAHRGGEITKAKVVKDRELIEIGKKLANTLKPCGEINFDCIKTENGVDIIEINGRFAGGSPISFKSGANSPKKIYQLLMNEELQYNENFEDGFIALRFDDAVYI